MFLQENVLQNKNNNLLKIIFPTRKIIDDIIPCFLDNFDIIITNNNLSNKIIISKKYSDLINNIKNFKIDENAVGDTEELKVARLYIVLKILSKENFLYIMENLIPEVLDDFGITMIDVFANLSFEILTSNFSLEELNELFNYENIKNTLNDSLIIFKANRSNNKEVVSRVGDIISEVLGIFEDLKYRIFKDNNIKEYENIDKLEKNKISKYLSDEYIKSFMNNKAEKVVLDDKNREIFNTIFVSKCIDYTEKEIENIMKINDDENNELVNESMATRFISNTLGAIYKAKEKTKDKIDAVVEKARGIVRDSKRKRAIDDLMKGESYGNRITYLIGFAIKMIVVWALPIGPILSALTASMIAYIDYLRAKATKTKEKARFIYQIGHELEIIEEKIKDAESDNNKRMKYELMRLKQKLLTTKHALEIGYSPAELN